MSIRTAVLVSGGGTNLQALIDAQNQDIMPSVTLSLVVSSKPNVLALKKASAAGIATCVLERSSYSIADDFDRDLLGVLEKHKIEVVVLAGFLCILGGQILTAYPNKIINVHPSLLPAFGGDGYYGLKVHKAALERGVKITGATVHLVNEVTDGGKILLQKAVEVNPQDTPEILQQRVMQEAEWVLLPKALQMLCKDFLSENEKGGFLHG